jgi:hypothetical protein
MTPSRNDLLSHKWLQSGLQLHMQFKLPTNVDLDENEDEKETYIIHF